MKASPDEKVGRGRPYLRLVPVDGGHRASMHKAKRGLGWRVGVGVLKVIAALFVGVFFVLWVLAGLLSLTSANGRGRMA